MSAEAYKAVRKLSGETWGRVEAVRMAVPEKRRPSQGLVQLVLREIAWCYLDDRGYADPTIAQIAVTLNNVSTGAVQAALKVLRDSGVVPVLRGGTRGQKGECGRAPRRGLSFYQPPRSAKVVSAISAAFTKSDPVQSLEALRCQVLELENISRTALTPFERQRARLAWQDKYQELRRRENV
jgi:hypothetical protein